MKPKTGTKRLLDRRGCKPRHAAAARRRAVTIAATAVGLFVILGDISIRARTQARADWKGNFDVTGVALPVLAQGRWQPDDWQPRPDGQRVTFLCVATERCPVPTAIEIKGVLRTENLPAAFLRGPLSPDELGRQGELNAQRIGSRFLGAVPIKIGGIEGVQMTAASGANGNAVHYLTTWLGRGDRMLDVKITCPDLALARKLATEVLEPLVAQVIK